MFTGFFYKVWGISGEELKDIWRIKKQSFDRDIHSAKEMLNTRIKILRIMGISQEDRMETRD